MSQLFDSFLADKLDHAAKVRPNRAPPPNIICNSRTRRKPPTKAPARPSAFDPLASSLSLLSWVPVLPLLSPPCRRLLPLPSLVHHFGPGWSNHSQWQRADPPASNTRPTRATLRTGSSSVKWPSCSATSRCLVHPHPHLRIPSPSSPSPSPDPHPLLLRILLRFLLRFLLRILLRIPLRILLRFLLLTAGWRGG